MGLLHVLSGRSRFFNVLNFSVAIMCYKMLNALVCIVDSFFKRSVVRNTRGSSIKLNKCHIILSRDGHFSVTVLLMRGILFLIILLLLRL